MDFVIDLEYAHSLTFSNQPNPSTMSKPTTTAAIAIANQTAKAVDINLHYVESNGVLYSVKTKDFAILKGAPTQHTLDKYFAANVLKHNPTCVFNTSTGRQSFDEARPMYYIGKTAGKPTIARIATAAEPAKVAKSISGGKPGQVAQTGPLTIYVRQGDKDTRPFSLKPEQFEALKADGGIIKFMARLKHLPTCVEMSLTLGLISTELGRPMYNLSDKGKLTQVLTEGQAKQLAKVEAPKVTKEKAPSKKEMADAKAAKAATPAPQVEEVVTAE